jgi:hypothetical protein
MVVATNERREDEEQTLRGEEEEEDKALRAANEANMMVCARTRRDKMKNVRHKFHPQNGFNSYHHSHTQKRPCTRIASRKQEKMGLTTMDSLWWGSVFVFGGGCVAAVRTGASKDSAYGKWKQKREEKEALKALEEKKKKKGGKK